MLKSLRLKNFRTHKDSYLKFCSGVNGIIGISASGKTNILRALKMLFTNRPLGNGCISRFSKEKQSEIESVWSGVGTIKMVKGKDSYYQINDDDPFRKIGTTVPDKIVDALFLSDINFHGQFDGPYLIFSSPPEISKVINNATGAEEFDIWTSNINNRIKDRKFALKEAKYREEKYKIQLENIGSLKRLSYSVKKLKEVSKEMEVIQDKYDELLELKSAWVAIKIKKKRHRDIIRLTRKIEDLKSIRIEIDHLGDVADMLENLENKKKSIALVREENKKFVSKYIKILKRKKICPTCAGKIKSSNIKELKRALSINVRRTRNI